MKVRVLQKFERQMPQTFWVKSRYFRRLCDSVVRAADPRTDEVTEMYDYAKVPTDVASHMISSRLTRLVPGLLLELGGSTTAFR